MRVNMKTEKEENTKLHEINAYEDPAFPIGVYTVTKDRIVPAGRGYMDLHWHEELQFTYVVAGEVHMQVNGKKYELSAGQGIFINRNLLHATTYLTADARYQSLNFPEKILCFFTGSRMEQENVLPYTGNVNFQAMVFTGREKWEREFLSRLREVFAQWEDRHGREYRIAIDLVEMWQQIISRVDLKSYKNTRTDMRKMERMQKMIAYVHANYNKEIHVADIAAAGNVSEGECNRSFRELVQKSPAQYVLFYRISQSMMLLRESAESVTDVAIACGFNDTSYFIRCFKARTGVTPHMYQFGKMSE